MTDLDRDEETETFGRKGVSRAYRENVRENKNLKAREEAMTAIESLLSGLKNKKNRTRARLIKL